MNARDLAAMTAAAATPIWVRLTITEPPDCMEPVGAGYAPIKITGTVEGNRITYPLVSFVFNAAGAKVVGWYVTDEHGERITAGLLDGGPWAANRAGDHVDVQVG